MPTPPRPATTRLRALAAGLLLAASLARAPAAQAAERPQVRIETSVGNFVVELDPDRAPLTVANFLEYVAAGHYSGLLFHRVVDGFIVQGGGYTPELALRPVRAPIPNEAGNGLGNRRGTIAMARLGEPHSADAQFYLNLADNVELDPRPTRWGYAVFGQVIQGLEVVDEIGHRATTERGGMQNVPVEPIVIRSVEVLREPIPR
jgi:peptidyl-prolyl cis-trans isomerase A (cyclophilin A)